MKFTTYFGNFNKNHNYRYLPPIPPRLRHESNCLTTQAIYLIIVEIIKYCIIVVSQLS